MNRLLPLLPTILQSVTKGRPVNEAYGTCMLFLTSYDFKMFHPVIMYLTMNLPLVDKATPCSPA